MLRLTIDTTGADGADLAVAAEALRRGGLVAFPTETFYGLAADPRNAAAVEAAYQLKGRPATVAMPLIAADLQQLADLVGRLSPLILRLAEMWWPGPLSIVMPAWAGLSPALLQDGTVAVRVSGLPSACALARVFGHPVTATSANPSGLPAACDPDVVAASLGHGVAVLLDGGLTPGGLPSTIVDATGDRPRLVRAGALPWDRVLECLDLP